MGDCELSVVATLYRSEGTVSEFCARAIKAAEQLATNFEIVLVNDGSPDASLSRAIAEHRSDPRVIVIDLSRNFGHHRAMMVGLSHARGKRVFLIDSDLEEQPEWLVTFWNRMDATGADSVYGVQSIRKGKFIERLTGQAFYLVLNLFAEQGIPPNAVIARLMTGRYVRALLLFRERELSIADLFVRAGFEQVSVTVEKGARGESTYTLRRKSRNAIATVLAASAVPLYLCFGIGAAITALSFSGIVYILVLYFFFATPPQGWTSLIISLWFFGGLLTMFLGTIGLYLSSVFREIKQQPYAIIREVYASAGKREPVVRLANYVDAGSDNPSGVRPK